eukprot:10670971-Prorocentrum_lima.AAC.1
MSSCEATRSTTPDGCSQSDKGGGGVGEGDGVSVVPSIAIEEPSCHDDECAKSTTFLCFTILA